MIRRIVLWTALVLSLCYAAIVAFIYAVQDRLVYLPDAWRSQVATPAAAGLPYEDVTLHTADGETLHGWFMPPPGGPNVAGSRPGALLVLHGNAGNVSHQVGYLAIAARAGFAALAIDYRGYGRSSGAPSEAGLYRDVDTAWRHLVETRGMAPERIAVVGESLGGGVATWLATERKIGALVLVSTFTSVPDVGAPVYWFLPVRILSRARYGSLARMPRLDVPVLVAHSPADEIIPYSHAQALYQAARGPKRFLNLAGSHGEARIHGRSDWAVVMAEFLQDSIGKPVR